MDELVARADGLARAAIADGRRRLLGICGAPGTGKSTVAGELVVALGGRAVCVGMDGFHLAQTELARLGRTNRKGAPDTFDPAGYLALLRRLKHAGKAGVNPELVYAPKFRREIEEPVGSAIPVPPETPLVVTEGNYLLLDEPPWHLIRDLLDEVWFLAPDEDERLRRLVARHRRFGRTPAEAQQRATGVDAANAARVTPTAARADLVVHGC